jgi:hypothetical protein
MFELIKDVTFSFFEGKDKDELEKPAKIDLSNIDLKVSGCSKVLSSANKLTLGSTNNDLIPPKADNTWEDIVLFFKYFKSKDYKKGSEVLNKVNYNNKIILQAILYFFTDKRDKMVELVCEDASLNDHFYQSKYKDMDDLRSYKDYLCKDYDLLAKGFIENLELRTLREINRSYGGNINESSFFNLKIKEILKKFDQKYTLMQCIVESILESEFQIQHEFDNEFFSNFFTLHGLALNDKGNPYKRDLSLKYWRMNKDDYSRGKYLAENTDAIFLDFILNPDKDYILTNLIVIFWTATKWFELYDELNFSPSKSSLKKDALNDMNKFMDEIRLFFFESLEANNRLSHGSKASSTSISLLKADYLLGKKANNKFNDGVYLVKSKQASKVNIGNSRIGFINGIGSSLEEAHNHVEYLDSLSTGVDISLVYNQTHGIYTDLVECCLGKYGELTEPVLHIISIFEDFDRSSGPGDEFLWVCHSQGAIHTYNALNIINEKNPDLSKKIKVLAIAPAKIILKSLCENSFNYISEDIVPYFDAKSLNKDNVVTLERHKLRLCKSTKEKDNLYNKMVLSAISVCNVTSLTSLAIKKLYNLTINQDHSFQSETYVSRIKDHLEEFIISHENK